MKRGWGAILIWILALPAAAGDWDFYGSARMATFWTSNDAGQVRDAGAGPGRDDDDLFWDFQGNSVLGAKVKTETLKAQVELGLPSVNTHDGAVAARRIWGGWKLADGALLVVGKDYTPLIQFTSGQVFDEDNGLAGIGTTDSRRPGQVRLEIGDFQIAAIQPNTNTFAADFDGDPDGYLPKLEAAWALRFEPLTATLAGGVQYYRIEKTGASVNLTDDVEILSYIFGLELGAELGAFTLRAAGSFGQNWTNARWNDFGYTNDENAGAALKAGGGDTEDCLSWQAALAAGYKLSPEIVFEAGFGYRRDDNDAARREDAAWSAYLQAVVTLAASVYLVPEVGVFDYLDDADGDDEGSRWYAGLKWQIDF
jgi:hypothetical protein